MDRLAKKAIRMSIIKILDSRCRGCMMRTGEGSLEYCSTSCDAFDEIQVLSSQLNSDTPNKVTDYVSGKWTTEEEFYLRNHMDLYGVEHLAKKLNREPQFVFNKIKMVRSQKKKSIS